MVAQIILGTIAPRTRHLHGLQLMRKVFTAASDLAMKFRGAELEDPVRIVDRIVVPDPR